MKSLKAEFDSFTQSKRRKFPLSVCQGSRNFKKFYASFKKILATPLHLSIVTFFDGGSEATSIQWLHHTRKKVQSKNKTKVIAIYIDV